MGWRELPRLNGWVQPPILPHRMSSTATYWASASALLLCKVSRVLTLIKPHLGLSEPCSPFCWHSEFGWQLFPSGGRGRLGFPESPGRSSLILVGPNPGEWGSLAFNVVG